MTRLSRFKRPAFSSRVLASNQNVTVPVPLANGEPALLDRTWRRVWSHQPTPRPAASQQGGT